MPEFIDVARLARLVGRGITRRMLGHFIENMLREKKLVRLEKGIYAKAGANPYAVACKMYNGYIGMSSALYLMGLKEELEGTITVCVPKNMKRIRFLNLTFAPVNLARMAFGARISGDTFVSSYPKTIFDMLYRPKYAEFFDMFRALNRRNLTAQEWKELMYYLKRSNTSTIRRAGYALEHVAPQWFTNELNKLSDAKRGVSFFQSIRNEGFDRKWKIYGGFNIKRWKNAY